MGRAACLKHSPAHSCGRSLERTWSHQWRLNGILVHVLGDVGHWISWSGGFWLSMDGHSCDIVSSHGSGSKSFGCSPTLGNSWKLKIMAWWWLTALRSWKMRRLGSIDLTCTCTSVWNCMDEESASLISLVLLQALILYDSCVITVALRISFTWGQQPWASNRMREKKSRYCMIYSYKYILIV